MSGRSGRKRRCGLALVVAARPLRPLGGGAAFGFGVVSDCRCPLVGSFQAGHWQRLVEYWYEAGGTVEAMTRSSGEHLLRRPDEPSEPTLLELLFDLVFVFAFGRISDLLVAGLNSSGRTIDEFGKALLLLLALLMVWFATAWVTDLYDPHRPEIQFVIAGAMFGIMLMALALPRAFGSLGLAFAVAYVAIHAIRFLVLLIALRGHPAERRVEGGALWFGASAVAWIVGAFVHDLQRGALWTLAVAIAYTGALLLWPTPWTVRLRPRFPVAPEYLAERYRQFFTIALGEQLVTAGRSYTEESYRSGGVRVAFVVSVATVVVLWRMYTYPVGARLTTVIATAPRRDRYIARLLVAHTFMVAAVVDMAAGFEFVIRHPSRYASLDWVFVIFGGPVLFIVGQAILQRAFFAPIFRVRLTGLLVLVALGPVMFFIPLLAVAATATAVLVGITIADAAVGRRYPAIVPSEQAGRR
jgi:low temperature requirement protein LtrA